MIRRGTASKIFQKTKVTQVNKQQTIINLSGNSYKRTPRRKRRPSTRQQSLVEKISGRIFQECNGEPQTYFRSIDKRTSAIVQIENKSACTMKVIIHLDEVREITQNVTREQQVSFDVPSLLYLEIACVGEASTFCRGMYSVCLRNKLCPSCHPKCS
jgi:hypothetical protein